MSNHLLISSYLSPTCGPLTSFANGRRPLPVPGAAGQVPLAGDATRGGGDAGQEGDGSWGRGDASWGGDASRVRGDASRGGVTALLHPARSLISARERKFLCGDVEFVTGSGNAGMRGGQGVPGGGWLRLCAGKNPTLSFTSPDNLSSVCGHRH